MSERVTASLNAYRALPKVELHRHLEGSLRLDTLLDIAKQHGITIPADVLRLSTLVQIQEEDKFTFQNFLSKFNTLRLFYRSPDVIHRITREAIEDAGLQPADIQYVNAHGTSTPKGDATEISCLRTVFGPALQKIPVSSNKSQLGHTLGASAAIEAALAARRCQPAAC